MPSFALFAAKPCVMHVGRAPARAAVVLPSGAVAHVCLTHLLELLGEGGQGYPVVKVVGAAYVPGTDEVVPPKLRLLDS